MELKLTPLTEVFRNLVAAAPDAPAITHEGITVNRAESCVAGLEFNEGKTIGRECWQKCVSVRLEALFSRQSRTTCLCMSTTRRTPTPTHRIDLKPPSLLFVPAPRATPHRFLLLMSSSAALRATFPLEHI